MKKLLLLMFVVFVSSLSCVAVEPEPTLLRCCTFNIRLKNDGDDKAGFGWNVRRDRVANYIREKAIDVVGMQEVLHPQLLDLLERLPQYDYVGVGRADGKTRGEYSPIFYKKERFKKLEGGTFWISETPEKVGVKGWDAALPRICSYVHLQDKVTKKRFWFFNLHMDHIGVEARREGAKLIAKKITEMCGKEPAFVSGDFNVDQHNEAYRTIINTGVLEDSYELAEKKFATTGTFNSFDSNLFTESRIDHIFVTEHVTVNNYAVLTDGYWTPNDKSGKSRKGEAAPQEINFSEHQHRCPSDHYPIAAKITFKKK